jgi:hypothetical protein
MEIDSWALRAQFSSSRHLGRQLIDVNGTKERRLQNSTWHWTKIKLKNEQNYNSCYNNRNKAPADKEYTGTTCKYLPTLKFGPIKCRSEKALYYR